MLHNPWNQNIGPVADRIDLHLFALEVFIDQYRMAFVEFQRLFHVPGQFLLALRYLHTPSAKHIARPYQHRIAQCPGDLLSLTDGGNTCAGRLRNALMIEKILEPAPVFRQIDYLSIGTKYGRIIPGERCGQIDRRLPAELKHRGGEGADQQSGILILKYVQDAFPVEGLKVKAITGIEVG